MDKHDERIAELRRAIRFAIDKLIDANAYNAAIKLTVMLVESDKKANAANASRDHRGGSRVGVHAVVGNCGGIHE